MNTLRHTILGLFFFVTVALLGFVTIYLGDVGSGERRHTTVVSFPEVDGLGTGDPVLLYGVPCGRVVEVAFTPGTPAPEERLRVTLETRLPLDLREDYRIAIGSPSLLGGKQLDVRNGTGRPLTEVERSRLRGRPEANVLRDLGGLVDENRSDVRTIVHGVASLVSDLDSGKRSLAQVALSNEQDASLTAALGSARSILGKIDSGEGSFAKALNEPALHDELLGFFQQGRILVNDIREKPGTVHDLLFDETLAAQVRSGVAGFADVGGRLGRGEGLLGKLTTADSEATWSDFQAITRDVRGITADLRAGKGALGRFLSDPAMEQQVVQFVDRASTIAADVAAITDGIQRGQGVLGLLVADGQARRTVERVIDQLARALEDAREAAPVSSVASFLFGQL